MGVKQDSLNKLTELVDKVIDRESIPSNSESGADLHWIKFYAKEIVEADCQGCSKKLLIEALNELDAIASACPHFATAALAERKAFSLREKMGGK